MDCALDTLQDPSQGQIYRACGQDRAVLSPTTRGSMHGEMGHTKFIKTISTSLPARLSATRDTGMEWAVN